MLRGSSRHDGIPNKQSAKERDRDRQRERQKQERAQMLPNDEKDIGATAQDLFHAPVKVRSEDRATVEVRNSFGNFETVRHYMLDTSSRRLVNLIGVDQNSVGLNSVTSVQQGLNTHNSEQIRPVPTVAPSSGTETAKTSVTSHPYRSNTVQKNSTFASNPNTSAGNIRTNSVPASKVSTTQAQLPSHTSSHGIAASAPLHNHQTPLALGRPKSNYTTSNSANSHTNNILNNISATVEVNDISIAHSVDKNSNNTSNTAFSESIKANSGNQRAASNKKQPALQRADSQLELESMLKEMMDVKPPLTQIQTPVKETPAKKFPQQRRSSKSEEHIVLQSIIESGMANVPSPLKRMDSSAESSSSYETESSESDSEDSSSGSQTGVENPENSDLNKITPVVSTNSPTRWNLSSFIRKDPIKGTPPDSSLPAAVVDKSPNDFKPKETTTDLLTSKVCVSEVQTKTDSSVTSTSVLGKSLSASPIEPPAIVIPRKSPRLIQEARLAESHIPPKDASTTIPAKGATSKFPDIKGPSLSGSSSEEESDKKTKDSVAGAATAQTRRANAAAGATTNVNRKRRRKESTSSSEIIVVKQEFDSSPETKSKKSVQDRNKSDTIRKLFRPAWNKNQKNDSPTLEPEEKVVEEKGGKGKGNSIAVVGTKPANTNRVSSKDSGSGRKGAKGANVAQNGSTNATAAKGAAATKNAATPATASGAAARKRNNAKDTKPNVTVANQSKKQTKANQNAIAASATAGKFTDVLPVPISASAAMPPPAAKIKEEVVVKANPVLQALICRIPLCKLPRKPRPVTATSTIEKPTVKESAKASSSAGTSAITEPYRLRNTINSRVGSTSDQTADTKRAALPDIGADLESNSKGAARKKQKKNKVRTSPRKSKVKTEPDSLSKVDDDPRVACGEVSSNVLGYMACDSVSASTSRTPPIELDAVQAPDSSLNPPHLPSPAVVPPPVYFSYFEKHDHQEEFNARDQDTYLEEAKRLKHRADNERVSTAQASTYLEAGLYFILTGISMEKDRAVGSTAAYTMYKDTLNLIRYIGSRFRNKPEDSNSVEAKIIILSMRCQALLSLKLFKIKMRETKEIVQYLQEHFAKIPPLEVPPVPNSPQVNTPSPHTPSASPAGSSAATQHTPSPHHPQNNTTVPRSLYAQMFKQCNNTMNLINAHELWEAADGLVDRYHVEEFFISIDRTNGPLTLHNPLADLVRYVKQGLLVLKSSAEIS